LDKIKINNDLLGDDENSLILTKLIDKNNEIINKINEIIECCNNKGTD